MSNRDAGAGCRYARLVSAMFEDLNARQLPEPLQPDAGAPRVDEDLLPTLGADDAAVQTASGDAEKVLPTLPAAEVGKRASEMAKREIGLITRIQRAMKKCKPREAENLCPGWARVSPLSAEQTTYHVEQMARLLTAMSFVFDVETEHNLLNMVDFHCVAVAVRYGPATDLLKSFTSWPLAAKQEFNDNRTEVPKPIEGWDYTYLLGVSVRTYIRKRVTCPWKGGGRSDRSLRLAWSLLLVKKSAVDASEAMVYEALKGHGREIGSEDPPAVPSKIDFAPPGSEVDDWQALADAAGQENSEWNMNDQDHIKLMIRLICSTLLESPVAKDYATRSPSGTLDDVLPTGKASYGGPRKEGGAVSECLEVDHERLVKEATPTLEKPDPLAGQGGPQDAWRKPASTGVAHVAVTGVRPAEAPIRLKDTSLRRVRLLPPRPPGWVREEEARWTSSRVTVETTPTQPVRLAGCPVAISPTSSYLISPGHEKWEEHVTAFYEAPEGDRRVACSAVPVLEPFKVRIITAGEGVFYLESRRLQRLLTHCLKHGPLAHFFPALQGRVTEEVLMGVAGKWLEEGDYSILSGDYKGATDTLRKEYCVETLESILDMIPQYNQTDDEGLLTSEVRKLREIMTACLSEHRIEYSFKGKKEWGGPSVKESWSVDQMKGQLMGSFLSFPILNIVNLAVNLSYLIRAGVVEPWAWPSAPVVVNGDDVFAVGPRGIFDDTWEKYVGLVGFRKSLGKNYVSSKFCTINTQLYQVVKTTDGPWLQEVTAIPFHHLFKEGWADVRDLENVVDGVPVEGPAAAGVLLDRVTSHFPEESDKELWTRFFMLRHRKSLDRLGLPWYLPGDLGGFGIKPWGSLRKESRPDAMLAAYLIRSLQVDDLRNQVKAELPVLQGYSDSRPCDVLRARLDTEYMKACGWTQLHMKNPSEEWLAVCASRPRAPSLDPLGLLLAGHVPEPPKVNFTRLNSMKRKLKALQGQANNGLRLDPVDLRQNHRVLWVPRVVRLRILGYRHLRSRGLW